MIQILRLLGTDQKLYPIVGPLVMNPAVLKYNNHYPFKTGEKFLWYIATDEQDNVLGFIPLQHKRSEYSINNYYAQQENHDEILTCLLNAISDDYTNDMPPLTALVQTLHKEVFGQQGFRTVKEWKLYIKMEKTNERSNN